MAQLLATSAQVIYEALVSDATFVSMLGSYDWVVGGSNTAISIVSPGEDLPSAKGVSGVECIINDVGDMSPTYQYDGITSSSISWKIFLVAWDGSTGADVQVAAERICSRFPGSLAFDTAATPEGLGSLVQTLVQVKSNMPILAP